MTATTLPPKPEALMDRQQIAEFLNVCVATLDNWIKKGAFPKGIMLGRSRRWKPQAVRDWLASQETEQAA